MEYEMSLAILAGISVLLALSLNLITGFCGQISLGHAAFFGVGAYCAAMLSKGGAPFGVALAAGTLLAGLFGVLVGFAALRVRHDFLAITTMGAGFLFLGVIRQQDWLGGEMGIFAIPDPGIGKLAYMLLVLGAVAATIALSVHVKKSWMGFAFDAVADDEDTARMVGVDVARYKLAAFAMGTAIAGLAGGLYAHDVRYVGPESFGFVESVAILSMVVVGGIGSVAWVAVAAILLSLLPQTLQVVADYKLLLYGGLLFAFMRFCPGGLAGLARSALARAKPDAMAARPTGGGASRQATGGRA